MDDDFERIKEAVAKARRDEIDALVKGAIEKGFNVEQIINHGLIAGMDVVAVDATACRVMGIEPSEIYHIRRAYERGLGEMRQERIEVIGSRLMDVVRKFKQS